jgi:hypothetical protein
VTHFDTLVLSALQMSLASLHALTVYVMGAVTRACKCSWNDTRVLRRIDQFAETGDEMCLVSLIHVPLYGCYIMSWPDKAHMIMETIISGGF